ncbi:hypothetical protein CCB80_00270 [Armatimonadetes bacterium Uphvl-Ar1]|nr:hypothetical protein CCB80_00270 [Armatimonadetes bacterium Uphvl-Ar1]
MKNLLPLLALTALMSGAILTGCASSYKESTSEKIETETESETDKVEGLYSAVAAPGNSTDFSGVTLKLEGLNEFELKIADSGEPLTMTGFYSVSGKTITLTTQRINGEKTIDGQSVLREASHSILEDGTIDMGDFHLKKQ